MNEKEVVYICSKFSGDVEGNTAKARVYSRYAVEQGVVPIAPHLLLPQFLSEETERELAISMDILILSRCDALWVFGNEPSAGMQMEIEFAKQKGIPIKYFSRDVEELQ